jgi:hypothetical protein
MGIDRIGNGPPVPEVAGPAGSQATGPAFQVPAPTAAAAPPAPGASTSVDATRAAGTALERLRAGEIDLGGYVDQKVHEATAHLSALPPVELEKIRGALRERLASDPTLVDLLQTATGETLPSQDD